MNLNIVFIYKAALPCSDAKILPSAVSLGVMTHLSLWRSRIVSLHLSGLGDF